MCNNVQLPCVFSHERFCRYNFAMGILYRANQTWPTSAEISSSKSLLVSNHIIGVSGEILFVNQSNFFLNNNADRHPSSRNTQQEYSFHLYCGGASPTKHTILTILCNYAPASGKSRPVSPNASHSWFKHLDSLHIYSIGAAIRKDDEWESLDGPKWRHTLPSVQIQCTVRWNYARWGQI